MKSSFLLALTLLCSSVVWGQTRSTQPKRQTRLKRPSGVTRGTTVKRKTPAPVKKIEVKAVTPAVTPVAKSEGIVQKTSYQRFSDRLKIGYFGAYSGSSLGQWDEKALDEKATKDGSYVHNLWNQVSFRYHFGAKFDFVINPRFTLNTASTRGHAANNKGMLSIEDPLVGFQGVAYSSDDKKFAFWTRLGIRLPLSRGSRANDISHQPEKLSQFTYDFNKEWQLGAYMQLRWWVFEDQYTPRRYRVYLAPYLQYAITDTDKVAVWYENYSENRNHWKSFNGEKHKFQTEFSNAMVSYSKDITPKINFMPFIGYYLNSTMHIDERPLDAAWLGFWLSWSIK
jgi:hypothetical protein